MDSTLYTCSLLCKERFNYALFHTHANFQVKSKQSTLEDNILSMAEKTKKMVDEARREGCHSTVEHCNSAVSRTRNILPVIELDESKLRKASQFDVISNRLAFCSDHCSVHQ